MNCLSLWQPWGSAIFAGLKPGDICGLKPDETRHWPTNMRGRVAIHAARKVFKPGDYAEEFIQGMRAQGFEWRGLPVGVILGTVEIVACRPTALVSASRSAEQLLWGNYERGRWAFELRDPRPFSVPIPCIGRQGFFRVNLSEEVAGVENAELNLFGGMANG